MLSRQRVAFLFLGLAPLALLAAGGFLVWHGATLFQAHWSPRTIALTHMATLAFTTSIAIGSIYLMQACETHAGERPGRLPLITWLLLTCGIWSLILGLGLGWVAGVFAAIGLLFPGFCCFLIPALRAPRSAGGLATGPPMRVALISLSIAAILGIWVAHGHGGMRFPGSRGLWLQVHLGVALLGWVGCFGIAASEWSRTRGRPAEPRHDHAPLARVTLLGIIVSSAIVVLDYAVSDLPATRALAAGAAAPAAVSVWLVHPLGELRRRPPLEGMKGARRFWTSAFAIAPVCAIASLGALLGDGPKLGLAFGWIAVWGWAGMIAHASLDDALRLDPGPVGAHGDAPNEASTARREHPESAFALPAWSLHWLSIASGLGAIVFESRSLARGAGALLLVLAGVLALRFAKERPLHGLVQGENA